MTARADAAAGALLVSGAPPAKADPMAVYRSPLYRIPILAFVIFLAVAGLLSGPGGPGYALALAWATSALVPALPNEAIARRLPARWLRVPAQERALHRIAGVPWFARLLDRSGWNRRVLEPLRGFTGRPSGLAALERGVLGAEIGHGIGFAIHLLLAARALAGGYPWSVTAWLLGPAVVLHLYPVLLQRSLLLRLQPLLDKPGAPNAPPAVRGELR